LAIPASSIFDRLDAMPHFWRQSSGNAVSWRSFSYAICSPMNAMLALKIK